jgi:hypothetical protein
MRAPRPRCSNNSNASPRATAKNPPGEQVVPSPQLKSRLPDFSHFKCRTRASPSSGAGRGLKTQPTISFG